jgi:elongation factor 2
MSNIRNFSVIAHVDSGKSTLCDTLLATGKIIAEKDAGTKRGMSARSDEKERGITIKSIGATINVDYAKQQYKLNVVDTPGHASFNQEVSCALRITDGCLIMIDCVEGIQVQTETVLRQAIQEKIKPVLVINKIDRLFLELQETPSNMYFRFEKQINGINELIKLYSDNDESLLLDPLKGNVIFSSAYFGWGFSLKDFARFYAKKNGGTADRYIKMLWNTIDKKSGNPAFCQLIMDPIQKIFTEVMNNNLDEFTRLIKKLGVNLDKEELQVTPKKLFGNALHKLFPLSSALTELIIDHLPSPIIAQAKRVSVLYNGPLDDMYAESIRTCNPDGPLIVYISKMIPDGQNKFIGFGRVFSGTLKTGQKINIMDANYDPLNKVGDFFLNKTVQRCCTVIAGKFDSIDQIECGNTCGIIGIDQYLVKTGTLVDATNTDSYNIRTIKFSVSPVVKVAVKPTNAADIPAFISAIKKLVKSDPAVLYNHDEETKEITISGTGELHMEICLHDLTEYFGSNNFIVSSPVVTFRETVEGTSPEPSLAKSANKHNRIYMTAEPLSSELIADIELGRFNPQSLNVKERNAILVDKYGFQPDDVKKIMAFGPEGINNNVLIDCTKGCQHMAEVSGSIIAAFNNYMLKGPISEEQVRGVRINVHDLLVHADNVHRGGDQIIPMCRKGIYSSMLRANPVLFEPIFLVDIQIPDLMIGTIYNTINNRRGVIIGQEKKDNLPLTMIKAWLPVAESFGLNELLAENTGGHAFISFIFDCYQRVPGELLIDGSKNNEYTKLIRSRKQLNEKIPLYTDYLDKL